MVCILQDVYTPVHIYAHLHLLTRNLYTWECRSPECNVTPHNYWWPSQLNEPSFSDAWTKLFSHEHRRDVLSTAFAGQTF